MRGRTLLTEAVICDGVRTPIGRYGGALADMRPDDLAAVPIRALLDRNPGLAPDRIDEVLLGCANQAGEDNRNVARMAALLAGLPVSVPGTDAQPFVRQRDGRGRHRRAGHQGGRLRRRDRRRRRKHDARALRDAETRYRVVARDGMFSTRPSAGASSIRRCGPAHGTDSMPQTADNVAEDFGISRADQDAFALRSQERWARADAAGLFADEIAPVTMPRRKGEPVVVDRDEHPRPGTHTAEALAKLRGINGADLTVTAGNASGVNDGAAALLIAECRRAAEAHGLAPMARVLGMASAGVEPRIMGIGPVDASRKVLDRLGLGIGEMDVIELNEAFASQALATLRALGVPDDAEHVNPNGGAIALGHPLGMSGARLVLTAARQLRRTGGRYALCTMCVGVGQGTALVIERV
jgi:acetyl-CoA acetyltransferase family protein